MRRALSRLLSGERLGCGFIGREDRSASGELQPVTLEPIPTGVHSRLPRDGDDPDSRSQPVLVQAKNFTKTTANAIPFNCSPDPFRSDDPCAQPPIGCRIKHRKNDEPRMKCLPAFAHLRELTRTREAPCFWKSQAQTEPFAGKMETSYA